MASAVIVLEGMRFEVRSGSYIMAPLSTLIVAAFTCLAFIPLKRLVRDVFSSL